MTSQGTCYFTSRQAAFKYYKKQGIPAEEVRDKIKEGAIHIGIPTTKEGERLVLNQEEGRWMIVMKRVWKMEKNK